VIYSGNFNALKESWQSNCQLKSKQGDSIFKSDYILTLVIFFRDHKLVIDNLFLGSNPQTLTFCLLFTN
ncbi:hypothetical protein ABTZ12_20580, partial [Escherichia coli]